MTALEIYKAQYDEQSTWSGDRESKYEWAASNIFELCTYDGGLDERFVKDILEVCKVILDQQNYEYIEDENNYVKYILVCQTLRQFNWIDWGISLRGAYFHVDHHPESGSREILGALEWHEWDPKEKRSEAKKIEGIPFSAENLRALITFLEE